MSDQAAGWQPMASAPRGSRQPVLLRLRCGGPPVIGVHQAPWYDLLRGKARPADRGWRSVQWVRKPRGFYYALSWRAGMRLDFTLRPVAWMPLPAVRDNGPDPAPGER